MKTILKKVTCVLMAIVVMIGILTSEVNAASVKYKTYSSARFQYTVKYPSQFTKKTEYGTGDGTKLISADGKAQASIWNSYGTSKKRNGTTVIATAKKNRKITVVKSTAKEANYYYKSGKNFVQYYHYFLANGELAFQITYPKSKKAYYDAGIKGMIKSVKANKQFTLKD